MPISSKTPGKAHLLYLSCPPGCNSAILELLGRHPERVNPLLFDGYVVHPTLTVDELDEISDSGGSCAHC
jgi:hypothetical protein